MRIAHLSDLHLLEPAARPGFDVRFVSLGRPLDAGDRARKARRAIDAARREGAEHFVFSGDLTETGSRGQFEAFAELLSDAALKPDEVTLVPGNHDMYDAPDAWTRALDGPLRAFGDGAATVRAPGKVVDRGGVVLLPVDTTFHQPVTRSAGRLTEATATALAARLRDPALRRGPIVVVTHHPPHRRPGPWHWVDGMLGCERLLDLVARCPQGVVLHGHLHKTVDRMHGLSRVVGASAVVDDEGDCRAHVVVHDIASEPRRLDWVA